MPRVKIAPPRRPARRRANTGLLTWPPTPRAMRIGAIAGGVALVLGCTLHVWRTGLPDVLADTLHSINDGAVSVTASAGLVVQEIFVEGRGETPAPQVLAALDLKRGSPILAFDPAEAKAELERLPWVKEAAVERRLPDTVRVRLTERRPLALWQRHGKLALIDRDGVEIKGADPARFSALPMVVGDDAPHHAAPLLALLATEPELGRRVTAAVRVGSRRWNLRLDAGEGASVDVQLPERNAGAAWSRLAELERTNRLLDRSVSVIDLRIPDRLIVRAVRETPPAAPARGRRNTGRPT